jgi:hypothetical protein
MCFQMTLAAVAAVLFSGCTNSRCYSIPHDRLVEAAVHAISAEAAVKPEQIKRTEKEELGGRLTLLEAPYMEYSKIEVTIDSRGKFAGAPELGVLITTGKDNTFYTRHENMAERVHEAIVFDLRARQHRARTLEQRLEHRKLACREQQLRSIARDLARRRVGPAGVGGAGVPRDDKRAVGGGVKDVELAVRRVAGVECEPEQSALPAARDERGDVEERAGRSRFHSSH